jgi:glutaredoxin-related protein
MKKRGYLGIDESNHGRYPEIFVAVFSTNPADIKKRWNLEKKRNKGNIFSLLNGREFKHIRVTKDYGNFLDVNDISLIVFSEFIKFFKDNLELVIIDGEMKKGSNIEKLERILYPNPIPKIKVIPKADTKYEIVNVADRIANLLYRHYYHFKNVRDSRKYFEYLITPKIEDYLGLFKDLK